MSQCPDLPTTNLELGEFNVSHFPPSVADRRKPIAVSKVICCRGLGLFSMPKSNRCN